MRIAPRVVFLACALCAAGALADTYDATTNQLSMTQVQVGSTVYTNVVVRLGTFQVLSVGSHALLPGIDTYDPSTQRLTLAGVQAGSADYGNVVVAIGGDFAVLSVGGSAAAVGGAAPAPRIAQIRVAGPPVLVFDHLVDKRAPFHLPDLAATAWKEADGTVNVPIIHFENYRMRGPDLEHLSSDPTPTFSSTRQASEVVESRYDYHHWIGAPYTLDGRTIYALAHTEWYACLLNADCNVHVPATATSTGSYQLNSWANTITSFASADGGASWAANGLADAHVVANESFTWTGSAPFAAAVYRQALDHSGLMSPSRIVKEGGWYYSIGYLVHRDFTRIDPATLMAPIDKFDWVIMRTADVSTAAGWQGWVEGSTYAPMALHGFTAFSPKSNGANLNAAQPQIIYDTNAQVYIAMFVVSGRPDLYYVTTPSLSNPSWSDAKVISGSSSLHVDPRNSNADCPVGFVPDNYPSLIDSHSPGLNFEFTDGDPWLFYVLNPADCGGDNLARDLYRLQLAIDYQ